MLVAIGAKGNMQPEPDRHRRSHRLDLLAACRGAQDIEESCERCAKIQLQTSVRPCLSSTRSQQGYTAKIEVNAEDLSLAAIAAALPLDADASSDSSLLEDIEPENDVVHSLTISVVRDSP